MTAPAVGRIEQAMRDIKARLGTIRIENGYATTIQSTWRHIIDEDDLNEANLPAAFVLRAPGDNPVEQDGDGFLRQRVRVVISAYARPASGLNPEAANLATTAEVILADLKRLALADRRWGGTAILDSMILSDACDAGWDEPTAVVALTIECVLAYSASEA